MINLGIKNGLKVALGKMEQQNIIDPIIKMSAVICMLVVLPLIVFHCIILASFIIISLLIFFIGCYIYCLIHCPDRLHTEKYQLECKNLEFQYNSKYEVVNYENSRLSALKETKLIPLDNDKEEKL